MKDMSPRPSGRAPSSFSVYAEHAVPFLNPQEDPTGSRLIPGCDLNTLVVWTVSPGLRTRLEGKNKDQSNCVCEILDLKSKGSARFSGFWLGSRWCSIAHWSRQDSRSHPRAVLFCLNQEYPAELGDWTQEGWSRSGLSHIALPQTGHWEQENKIKFFSVQCLDWTPLKPSTDRPAWGFNLKTMSI